MKCQLTSVKKYQEQKINAKLTVINIRDANYSKNLMKRSSFFFLNHPGKKMCMKKWLVGGITYDAEN